ncbi:hypothetical protein GCM10023221_12740 [Luteimicrobium xylanilyticum]|uniref:Microcin J25-processing protein McjB C-terminal domain-containing protein n=1 Tax=Luteimicrobium xylanilyticum TaxID=1133546 RepID=A0A5P9QCR5_9MICO|nr:lasso peptide biosynthesis B2 protein [Luteimicrobium xylanilyticum]QFU99253.1 hypothetical protein KDY119_02780 [Luteimicrobium xylanilyticum]
MSAGTAVRRLATAARLPARQKVDAVQLVIVATTVELGLRLTTLPRLARLLRVRVALDAAPSTVVDVDGLALDERERERLDVAWRILRRRPFNGTCLRRAMLGGFVLRRRDHAVRIGVRKANGIVAAHAWLELDGVSLDPDGVRQFHVLGGRS